MAVKKKRAIEKKAVKKVTQNTKQEIKEKTVNTAELAELFNLSVSSIKKLRQDGVIEPLPNNGNRKAGNEWLPLQCATRVLKYYQKMVDSRGAKDTEEMKKAKERQILARAEKEELELAEIKSELHRAKDIEKIMGLVMSRLRINLLAIPKSVAPILRDQKDVNFIAEKINERICRALHEIVNLDLREMLIKEGVEII